MKIFAYCTEVAGMSVAKATGVYPLTSPPLTATTLDSKMLEGYDLLYFRLHAFKGGERWYGESLEVASLPKAVRGVALKRWPALDRLHFVMADLGGAIVVLANCYGASSPLVQAMYKAGASVVIAGSGPNYAAGNRVMGADLLVQQVIRGLQAGKNIKKALRWARMRLLLTAWRKPDRDALGFRIIRRVA